jgi:hypothetical protein
MLGREKYIRQGPTLPEARSFQVEIIIENLEKYK